MPFTRRTMLRLAAAILAGLVSSVAVAAWCAARSAFTRGDQYFRSDESGAWRVWHPPSPRPDQVSIATSPGTFAARRLSEIAPRTPALFDEVEAFADRDWLARYAERDRERSEILVVVAGWGVRHRTLTLQVSTGAPLSSTAEHLEAGWPFACLRAHAWASDWKPVVWRNAIPLSTQSVGPGPRPRILPTALVTTGLLANTAVYAAPVFGVLTLGPRLTRHLRLRRNHCPRCNYNRHGLPAGAPCPECGPASLSAP